MKAAQLVRSAFFSVAALLVVAGATPVAAADEATITGQIVYVNCYLKFTDVQSDGYQACSGESTRRGQSLALIAADGMYIIKGDWTKNKNEKLAAFIDQKVVATGDVSEIADKKLIKISDVKAAK